MAQERLARLPDAWALRQKIESFRLRDGFGARMLGLIDAVLEQERVGIIQGYAQWLLSYETSRRFSREPHVLRASWNSLNQSPLQRTLAFWKDRTRTQAAFLTWPDFLEKLQGKTLIFDKGGYRMIPTGSQLDHLKFGFMINLPHGVRAVMFEPAANIAAYKGHRRIFPDALRIEFLRHIPGVDWVVRIPEFGKRTPEDFWAQQNTEMHKRARLVVELVEVHDPAGISKISQWFYPAGLTRPVVPWFTRPDADLPAYADWRTSDWEQRTGGHEEFIGLAMNHLVEKRT